jgi:hypothetical protein
VPVSAESCVQSLEEVYQVPTMDVSWMVNKLSGGGVIVQFKLLKAC